MKKYFYIIGILILTISTSCTSLQESSKYDFESSKYYNTVIPQAGNKVYIDVEEDSIKVFPITVTGGTEQIAAVPAGIFTPTTGSYDRNYTFHNPSFDLDILTMPLKYRFKTAGVPQQLTTNFNGNVYLGFRNDMYSIRYDKSPLGETERKIRHVGFSLGGFAGLSSEPVNPWVTREMIDLEYDGMVFSTGVAGIIGFNGLTAGLALGFDHLLDTNRQHWIYQGKPWIGLAFGINLN
ncbi:hypothetical protein FHG64_08260 [Antarcticibacterium flavum]|uniref:Uncharacterized protein n=1 Tax=Antarcticibacterium flavum TaxID=2058175 RepID=A0A5B7X1K3_9FLAO|nr:MULTISPECIES: hypothetical protein [Antarcticibacterium]MCM4161112.1 hypothetical protein [Antarcticibacterium sp. W02-3]QCY69386.1 hypothetical protein FHG64_08260 [Antarcticibacterium flavum]